MTNFMGFKTGCFMCLLYGGIAIFNQVHASKIVVKNNVNAPVEVIIQHDSESELMAKETPLDSPEIKDVIEAGGEKIYEITKTETSYNKKFSIIGKVNFYSLSDRCSGLTVNQDYNVILNPKENGGVKCSYAPMPKLINKAEKRRTP